MKRMKDMKGRLAQRRRDVVMADFVSNHLREKLPTLLRVEFSWRTWREAALQYVETVSLAKTQRAQRKDRSHGEYGKKYRVKGRWISPSWEEDWLGSLGELGVLGVRPLCST